MTTHSVTEITILDLPSKQPVRTMVHIYEGPRDGPTVYIQAAQHGNEVNGTEVLRRLHGEMCADITAGTVITVPVANPISFDHSSYTSPRSIEEVHPNLNRVWPGSFTGTVHERIAAHLWEYARTADAIIDLHAMSPDALSHVVVTEGDSKSVTLATTFGTDLTLLEPTGTGVEDEWNRRNFSGKLRATAARHEIACITPELGNNKWIGEPEVDAGIRGIRNVLQFLGLMEGEVVENGSPSIARNHLGRVTATNSGLFVADSDRVLGETVTAGDHLGVVYNPLTYENQENVHADRDGILYVITRESTVFAGDTLANVALVD